MIWRVLNAFRVNHPWGYRGTPDLVEDQVQEYSNFHNDGELTFKYLRKGPAMQMHCFFIGRDGRKRRYMKLQEERG